MDGLDAVGDAVTGGLLARAVEPQAGESADGHTHEKNCLNCGTQLTGPYCSACGQKAHVHRSVRGFLQDFVQGLFNFEGKIWRTLPMLAWRPGEMTRRYIAGERARFISPVALYPVHASSRCSRCSTSPARSARNGKHVQGRPEDRDRRPPKAIASAGAETQADRSPRARTSPTSIARSPSARKTSQRPRRC